MIDKKIFVETINFIEENDKKMDKVDYALHQINNDLCNLSGLFFGYNETIITLLESLAPKDKADYISWWVYATSFGKKYTEIYDEKHNVVADLKTASDLYDYIFEKRSE